MRAVFVADTPDESASGFQRRWALEACGVEVFTLDKSRYPPPLGKVGVRLGRLLGRPRLLRNAGRLDRDLARLCERVRPDLVWMEWPREFLPRTLQRLRGLLPETLWIAFQDDNPWGGRVGELWMWRHYFRAVSQFDIHLVKRPSDAKHLIEHGARRCREWMHGVYRPLFSPLPSPARVEYPVSFVGTCLDRRSDLVRYLLEQGLPLHVFGGLWERCGNLLRRFPAHFHPEVRGKSYAEVVRQSQICLGLVSETNRDEWTMRSFEVPGCAGVLVAERTPSHESWFVEGEEAAFFQTREECVEVVRGLLAEPGKCRAMGEAAYRKCLARGWFLESRMEEFLRELGIHPGNPSKARTVCART